jgi:hypothetical protein
VSRAAGLGLTGSPLLLPCLNHSLLSVAAATVDHMQQSGGTPFEATRAMTPEELAALLASSYSYDPEVSRRPLLAVLDTSFVRTALHHQLTKGTTAASVSLAQDGSIRLFMEYETLVETQQKLPKFAKDFGRPVEELTQIINGWLPDITVVKLPPALRQLDKRALDVRACDPDDYPAAALTSLLSPCILLTHNHKDFGPLGVRTPEQAKDTVLAAVQLKLGEFEFSAMVMIPTAPFRAAGMAFNWASAKIGRPATVTIVAVVAVCLAIIYFKQPPERKDKIKQAAAEIGKSYLNELTVVTANVQSAQAQIRANVVPGPKERSPASAIARELALSDESLSAQQLAELLDESARPSVPRLRAFLRTNNQTVFAEVRHGGFVLGRHYRLP